MPIYFIPELFGVSGSDGSSRAKVLLERLCHFLDHSLLHRISSRQGNAYGPAWATIGIVSPNLNCVRQPQPSGWNGIPGCPTLAGSGVLRQDSRQSGLARFEPPLLRKSRSDWH